jgi:hypothetical protein
LQDISLEKMEEAFSRREYRRGGRLTELVEWRFQEMADFRLGPALEKLTEAGICRETLGFAMGFVWLSRVLDYCLKDLFGDRRARMRDAAALKRAVAVLKRMSAAVPNAREVKGLPEFEVTAKSLETYSMMLVWGEALYAFTGAGSCQEMAKYSLAGVVKRISGKFHDREVSAMTGAALGDFEYDETAHRVWRIRTYDRLERSFPLVPMALQALNNVLMRE